MLRPGERLPGISAPPYGVSASARSAPTSEAEAASRRVGSQPRRRRASALARTLPATYPALIPAGQARPAGQAGRQPAPAPRSPGPGPGQRPCSPAQGCGARRVHVTAEPPGERWPRSPRPRPAPRPAPAARPARGPRGRAAPHRRVSPPPPRGSRDLPGFTAALRHNARALGIFSIQEREYRHQLCPQLTGTIHRHCGALPLPEPPLAGSGRGNHATEASPNSSLAPADRIYPAGAGQ